MRNKNRLTAMIFALGLLLGSVASADVLYDQGGVDGLDGKTLNFVAAFDDFVLDSSRYVTGATLWVGTFFEDASLHALFDSGMLLEVALVGDAAGAPDFGNLYSYELVTASGLELVPGQYILPGLFDLPVYKLSFEFSSPVLLPGHQTLWLGVQVDAVTPPDVLWLSHTPVTGNPALTDDGSGLAPANYDFGFQVNGIPVAPTLAMLVVGLLAMRGRLKASS